MHLSAGEWQGLIAGRWDQNSNKKFFKQHRSTEFHVAGDPFTYRTDAKGKVVAVYDAQKSYNVTGARRGLPGVPLTLTGQPTFAGTPYLRPAGAGERSVVFIDMGGTRSKDFRAANEEAGLAAVLLAQRKRPDQAPRGYTWHHRDDFAPNPNPPPPGTCTMELVSRRAHRQTCVHYGSCDQCNKHFGKKMYT